MKIALFALAASCALCACSVADPSDMDTITNGVRSLPKDEQSQLDRNKENSRSMELMMRLGTIQDTIAGTSWCEEEPEQKDQITMKEVWDYARRYPDATLSQIKQMLADISVGNLHRWREAQGQDGCTPKFDWKGYEVLRSHVRSARRAKDDATDTAEWLVGLDLDELAHRPTVMVIFGLALAGGAIVASPTVLGLAICAQSEAISCPQRPDGSGATPGGAASTGGDQ